MALVRADGFEWYTTASFADGEFGLSYVVENINNSYSEFNGDKSSRNLMISRYSGYSAASFYFNVPSANEYFVSFTVSTHPQNVTKSSGKLVTFCGGTTTAKPQVTFKFVQNLLQWGTGDYTKVGWLNPNRILVGASWLTCVFRVKCHPTEGFIEVYVNGSLYGSAYNINTDPQNTGEISLIRIWQPYIYTYVDELVVWNTIQDGTVFTDLAGGQLVSTVFIRSYVPSVKLPDELDRNILLLLRMEGANNSTLIPDYGAFGKQLLPMGLVKNTDIQSKWGGTSTYFDGNSSCYIEGCDNFNFGVGALTIEGWVYWSVLPSAEAPQILFCRTNIGDPIDQEFYFYSDSSSTFKIMYGARGIVETVYSFTVASMNVATWYHVALTRDVGGVWRCFLNGTVSANTHTDAVLLSSNTDLDHYYNNVALLLHFDGANDSTTFVDSSMLPKTVTPYGNTKISTTQFKFGGTSGYFDGSGDYLQLPPILLGTVDFTIEFWIYATGVPNANQVVFTLENYPNTSGIFVRYISTLIAVVCGSSDIITTPFSLNQWFHFAIVRFNGMLNLYKDGVGATPVSFTNNLTDAIFYIGRPSDINSYNMTGYIDELRITKGIARYTANFTPPTTAFKKGWVEQFYDPYYVQTSLLLHFDGANDSTTFVDSSPIQNAITRYGDAKISALQSKFGGASGYFNTTDSYVKFTDNANFNLASVPWTIEGWIYPTRPQTGTQSGFRFIVGKRVWNSPSSSWSIMLWYNSEKIALYNGTAYQSTANISQNAWTHFAYSSDGSSVKLYLNGVLDSTHSITITNVSAYIYVGSFFDDTSTWNYFGGYIDELRITKGCARYTKNFTPPISAFQDHWPSQYYDPYYLNNTSLLLYFDGENNSTTFVDSSVNKQEITRFGDTKISTAQSKFGGSSGYFDGTGDYLRIPYNSTFNFSLGDFTVECWFNCSSFASAKTLISKSTHGSNYDFCIILLNATTIGCWSNGTGTNLQVTVPTMLVDTWYHVAFVRGGGTNTFYLNGVSYGSNTMGISNASQVYIIIGGNAWDNPTDLFQGYIDEFRITNEVARYTGNFTPPTMQYMSSVIPDDLNVVVGDGVNGYVDDFRVTTELARYVSSFSVPTAAFDSTDTNWSKVSLLLNGYGEIDSSIIIDMSDRKSYVDVFGGAKLTTNYPWINSSSCYFDGGASYLQLKRYRDLDLLDHSFTIELWFHAGAYGANNAGTYYSTLISKWGDGSNKSWSLRLYGQSSFTAITFSVTSDGITYTDVTYNSPILILNWWYHVAVVRSGSTFLLCFNGKIVASATHNTPVKVTSTVPVCIGADFIQNKVSGQFTGYMSELRILDNVTAYTGVVGALYQLPQKFSPPLAGMLPATTAELNKDYISDGTSVSQSYAGKMSYYSLINTSNQTPKQAFDYWKDFTTILGIQVHMRHTHVRQTPFYSRAEIKTDGGAVTFLTTAQHYQWKTHVFTALVDSNGQPWTYDKIATLRIGLGRV